MDNHSQNDLENLLNVFFVITTKSANNNNSNTG